MPIEIIRTDHEPKARRTVPPVNVRFRFFNMRNAMNWVALQMLTGDRAKYLGLIFTIAFSSFLIAQQISIFAGIMNRTRSQILDVPDADVWVMDPATQYFDEVYSLKDSDVDRVRGVPGVRWAVRMFKGQPRAKAPDGRFRVGILLGLDDATLAGAPEKRKMLLGSIESLRDPEAVIIDQAGYHFFFPGQPLALGKTFEMNDHRAKVVGIVDASAPFTTLPVFYSRYSEALNFVGSERNRLNCWNTKPMFSLRKRIWSRDAISCGRLPSTSTVPAVGSSNAVITDIRVVFPQPEGPTSMASSPMSMLRSSLRSTSVRVSP